jgi:hypothetical protein
LKPIKEIIRDIFIKESINDAWRAVASKVKSIHPKMADDLRFQRLDSANKHYQGMDDKAKSNVDQALKAHSHYHDLHGEFHKSKAAEPNTDKKDFDVGEHFPEGNPGSIEHFTHHAIGWLVHSVSNNTAQAMKHAKALAPHYNNKISGSEYSNLLQKHKNNPKSVHVPDDVRALYKRHYT